MNRLQKLLIIPIILPISSVIFIGLLNLNKPVTFRVLVWRTQDISIGLAMAVGASSGVLLGLLHFNVFLFTAITFSFYLF